MKAFKMPLRALSTVALACVMAVAAAAAPIGSLSLTNVAGGGVSVSNTLIDWQPPAGSGYGDFVTSLGTNITYSGGTIGSNRYGQVGDLQIGFAAPSPFIQFYTGAVGPSLQAFPRFDLTGFSSPGPTVVRGCSTVTMAAADETQCVPINAAFPGGYSPFILTWDANSQSTGVTLGVSMIGSDAAGTASWAGQFTTQLPGAYGSPAQIEALLSTGGVVENGYSAGFSGASSQIPEPATTVLIGSGLVLAGLFGRRRARATK